MITRKIIQQKNPLKLKLKKLIRYSTRKRGAKRAWGKRHESVLEANPHYYTPCSKYIEKKHRDLWSPFRKTCDISTLRICKNISGIEDPRFIPEDIFVSDIEPSLTIDSSVDYLSNKSFYNRWFKKGVFPTDYLHCIDGQFCDENLEKISEIEFRRIATEIKYPVVMKPNRGAYGGKDIFFVHNQEELLNLSKDWSDFIVQEKIEQDKFFKQFNPAGLNTIRVYLYRSVLDNELHIITMALRMGKDGSLDNETAGGIHVMITEYGNLNGYAVNKYGKKYLVHPNTKKKFNTTIPDFSGLKKLVYMLGSQVFLTRIIGLDLCYDKNGIWRAIEINTKGHSIRFAQYGGAPFFGEFTEEVIDYCKMNHWALNE